MPYKFIFALLLTACLSACSSSSKPQSKESPSEKDSLRLNVKTSNISIYTFPKEGVIDSTLMQNTRFIAFKNAMEDLSKLNPEGIQPFVVDALQACQRVERKPLPMPFNVPEITARLKVVKTQLIKVRYFTEEEKQEELNVALEGLYTAYNDYLKRIHSFSEEESLEQGEILLNPDN